MNHKATWKNNPALKVTVGGKTAAIVTLTQPDARYAGGMDWNEYQQSIGFIIYKSTDGKPKKKLKKKERGGYPASRPMHRCAQPSFLSAEAESACCPCAA